MSWEDDRRYRAEKLLGNFLWSFFALGVILALLWLGGLL